MFSTLDIVLPVYNESKILKKSVKKLYNFLTNKISINWRLVIAENGSSDSTLEIAKSLSNEYSNITVRSYPKPGRGGVIKDCWSTSNADLVCYMDIDLSTDLEALITSLEYLNSNDFDVVIGSRLLDASKVYGRSLKRDLLSRSYSMIFRVILGTKFKDAQCGFKAVSRKAAENLVPLVEDNAWFFDTELLLLAGKAGYAIKEIPVHWEDDPDTRVKIISTAWEDIKGLLRLRLRGRPIPPLVS